MREVPVMGAGEVVDAAATDAARERYDGLGGGLGSAAQLCRVVAYLMCACEQVCMCACVHVCMCACEHCACVHVRLLGSVCMVVFAWQCL